MKLNQAFLKRISRILSCLLLFPLLAALPFTASAESPAPTAGWAAEDGVWTIGSVGDMLAFEEKLKAGYEFAGETVKLTADIDLSGIEWTGYANQSTFSGTLDGQGHTVSHLTIANPTGGNIGLVLWIGDCVIRNIAFTDASINASAGNTCGILAAQVKNGAAAVLQNVFVSGSVTAPEMNRNMLGTIGIARGSLTATGCVFDVDVTGQKAVGVVIGGQNNTGTASFTDCAVYGSITKKDNRYQAGGGIIGILSGNGSFTRCISAVSFNITEDNASAGLAASFFCLSRTNANFAATLAAAPTVTLTDCYTVNDISGRYAIGIYDTEKTSDTEFQVNIVYTAPESRKSYESAELKDRKSELKAGLTEMTAPSDEAFSLAAYAPLSSWLLMNGRLVPGVHAKALGQCPVADALYYRLATSENADGSINICLASVINDLNYSSIGFAITVSRDDGTAAGATASGTTVYTSVLALGETVSAESLGGKYIAALVLEGIDYADYGHTFTVSAFVTLMDGTTVLSTAAHSFELPKKSS